VLNVSHNACKNSTMPSFLAAMHPRVAVTSAGEDNTYGHPNPELLGRLDGAVHVLTDGEQLDISCFVACPEATESATSAHAQPPDQEKHHEQ
jgi:beta-lactamase superfamily II metal-dependent hydrolase